MQYERFQPSVHGEKKQIFLVDMKESGHSPLFSPLAGKTLYTYLSEGKKVLIIGGKKGLASGVQCQDCGYIPKCSHCDIPIAYHRDQGGQTFGLCHICKTSYPAIDICPSCQGYNVHYFGTGLQKIEEYIATLVPGTPYMTLAAEQVSSLPKIAAFTQKLPSIQCLIMTSLGAVAPGNWKPDAVIIVRADSMLSVPDRKVAEHCYAMLTTCIHQYGCPIIVQAYAIQHHAIRSALANTSLLFWEKENAYREQYHYPPYAQMAVIFYRHEIEETMFTRVHKLYQELLYIQKKTGFTGEIFATPPLVYKMYDKYKYNIVIKGQEVRTFLTRAFEELDIRKRGFKIDWLPENII